MTTLSTHVLDTERGVPASGVSVSLHLAGREISHAVTNSDGRIPDLSGGQLEPGAYRLEFDLAAYFQGLGRSAPFLERVSIQFRVASTDVHLHVPLLLAPYAATTYRGS